VYLQTEHWKNKRLLKLSQADNKCQVCNSPDNLHVHHRVYGNLFAENDNDLIVLCGSCHQLFHKNKNPEIKKERATVSFSGGYDGPEETVCMPWFDKLPIEKVDRDKFWAEFLIFTKQHSIAIANVLSVFTFLGFDTDQDSAFIELGEDGSFCKSYFDDPDKQKELSKYFKEFCNKNIAIVSKNKNSNVLQVIK